MRAQNLQQITKTYNSMQTASRKCMWQGVGNIKTIATQREAKIRISLFRSTPHGHASTLGTEDEQFTASHKFDSILRNPEVRIVDSIRETTSHQAEDEKK